MNEVNKEILELTIQKIIAVNSQLQLDKSLLQSQIDVLIKRIEELESKINPN